MVYSNEALEQAMRLCEQLGHAWVDEGSVCRRCGLTNPDYIGRDLSRGEDAIMDQLSRRRYGSTSWLNEKRN